MSTIDKIVFLHSTSIFNALDLRQIMRIAQISEQVNLEKDTGLFIEGDEGHAVYVLVCRELLLQVGGDDTRTITPGDHVGEETLFQSSKRMCSVVSKQDSVLLCIFHEDMERLFARQLVNQSRFYEQLGSVIIAALRETYRQLEEAQGGEDSEDIDMLVARSGWAYDMTDFSESLAIFEGHLPKCPPSSAASLLTMSCRPTCSVHPKKFYAVALQPSPKAGLGGARCEDQPQEVSVISIPTSYHSIRTTSTRLG